MPGYRTITVVNDVLMNEKNKRTKTLYEAMNDLNLKSSQGFLFEPQTMGEDFSLSLLI